MRIFLLYTASRLGLALAAFGLIWAIAGRTLAWDSVTILYTALIALAISSVIALIWLRPMRDRFAEQVAARAERAKAAFEARSSAEDDD